VEENSENKNFILTPNDLHWIVSAVILFLLIFGVARINFGNEILGSWFEKPEEYTTQYWVYLEPDSSSTKNYRVKGDIEKIKWGTIENTDEYYLRTVYWNNGGESDFVECQITNKAGDNCYTTEDKNYFVRLGEKVD
jgi:hypothetical protein